MRGKQVVVTGPTSGVGRQIALELGAAGAELVLACRDLSKGEQVAREIAARSPAATVTVMHLDTSSRQSIAGFTRLYRARVPRLDVLVNNAGVALATRQLSVDGLELTFATNVLGYHLLSLALLDVLEASASARIVNVASLFAGHLDLDDLQFERRAYEELQAYAQSKACNRLLTWALARRLQGSRVVANAMTPGFVPGTGLTRNLSPALRLSYSKRTGRTVEQGADTAVWMASSPELEGVSGTFFSDRRDVPCEFKDPVVEERLWRICESLSPPLRPA